MRTSENEIRTAPASAVEDLLRMRGLVELLTADITEALDLLRTSGSMSLTPTGRQSIATAMGLVEQLTIELVSLRASVLKLSKR